MLTVYDYQLILDNLPGIYFILKPDAPDFTIIHFNKAGAEATMCEESVIGKKLFDAFTDNTNSPLATSVENLKSSLMQVIDTKKPHKMAERRNDLLNPETKEYEEKHWRPMTIPVLDRQDNLTCIIYLMEDITAEVLLRQGNRRTEEELNLMHVEQASILERIEDVFIATDRNWKVEYWNKHAELIFDIDRETILGKNLWDFIRETCGGKLYKSFLTALQDNKPVRFREYYALREVWLQVNVYPSNDGITAILVNITEIKHAEAELHASEKSYHVRLEQEVAQRTKELEDNRSLLQATLNGSLSYIQVFKAVRNNTNEIIDFTWILVNQKWMDRYGDVAGESLLTLNPAVVETGIFNDFVEVVNTGKPQWHERYYAHEQFDGWFYQSIVKLGDGILLTTDDITEHKKAELELLHVKEELAQIATDKYLKLFNTIDQGFCIVVPVFDDQGKLFDIRYREVNPAFKKITGIQDPAGKTSREVGHNFKEGSFDILRSVLLTGEPSHFEEWAEPLQKWVEGFAFPIEQGRERHIAVLFNDITKRKKIVQWQSYVLRLNDTLKILTNLIEIKASAARVLCMELKANRCFYAEINESSRLEQPSREEVYHTPDAPDDMNLAIDYRNLMDELAAGQNVVIDDVKTSPKISSDRQADYESQTIFAFIAVPVMKNNRMVAVLIVQQTEPRKWKQDEVALVNETAERTWTAAERAKAEDTIHRNEQRFRALIENITDGLAVISPTGTIREMSISAQKILGYDFKYFKGQHYRVLFFPDDLPNVQQAFDNTLEFQNVRDFYAHLGISAYPAMHYDTAGATVQFRFIKEGGGIRWLEGTFHNLLHEETIGAVVFTFRDITSRREQEIRLQSSEEKYRYLFQNNPAAIIVWTLEDHWIVEVNEAACLLYGYTRNEFLSRTFLDLKLADQQPAVPGSALNAQSENTEGQGIWQHKTKKGDIIYLDFTFHRINYSGIDAILTLGINVTNSVLLQKKLEEERHRKQKEITEAVITAQENERGELARELHDNISQILTTARMYIEHSFNNKEKQSELLQYSREHITSAIVEMRELSHRLMPPYLDDISLKQSLEELFLHLKRLGEFEFRFEFLLPDESNLSNDLKLAIYRIVQEGLNNIFRHAKATEIVVHIEPKTPMIELCIEDNGTGFDPKEQSFGLGLRNITSRANLLGGRVTLNTQPGNGTELKISFPANSG